MHGWVAGSGVEWSGVRGRGGEVRRGEVSGVSECSLPPSSLNFSGSAGVIAPTQIHRVTKWG